MWAARLQSVPGSDRRQAFDEFERAARKDEAFMESPVGLEGVHLTCHCQPSQRCNADVLIRMFVTLMESRPCNFTAPPLTVTIRQAIW